MSHLAHNARGIVLAAVLSLFGAACAAAEGGEADSQPSTSSAPTTVVSSAPTATAVPATTTTVAEGIAGAAADLSAELESWIAEYEVAGAVVAVSAPDEGVVVIPVGVVNKESGDPVQGDEFFRIGSITKMTTAAVLLQLQEEGLVDLDAPLTEQLPSWATRQFTPGAAITPRMLLNHTSGLIAYEADPDFSRLVLTRLNQPWKPSEIIDFAVVKGLLFEPGTEWSYGTTSYLLAGQLIEAVTGNPAHQELRDRILGPLDMADTYLPPAEVPPEPLVSGYYDLAGTGEETAVVTALPQEGLQSLGWTGGGLESTASDVVKLLPGIVDGGLLSDESLAQMATPAFDTEYGLGVNRGSIAGRDAWWHGGGVPGFRTQHAYFPESGVSIALLSNSSGPDAFAYIERAAKIIFG